MRGRKEKEEEEEEKNESSRVIDDRSPILAFLSRETNRNDSAEECTQTKSSKSQKSWITNRPGSCIRRGMPTNINEYSVVSVRV